MPKRKLHEFINNIEHKYCNKCDPPQWKPLNQFGTAKKWDGRRHCCKACRNKKQKQHEKEALEKRQKAREEASIGFSVCLNPLCAVKGLMQPVDQFIDAHVHNNKPTSFCLKCRTKKNRGNKRRYTACQKVWNDWRKTHPCLVCNQNPNYKHNYLVIEADHLPEFKKIKRCSLVGFWSHSDRGPRALRKELKKCQALCCFHHRLQTQQRDHDNGRIQKKPCVLRKRAVINTEKHKRGCCSNSKCKRPVKKGEERGFSFDHRDPTTKFIYNGKLIGPSNFVYFSQALFDTQWPLEQAKCDLLCANCDKLKTWVNRDGYKK